MPKTAPIAFFPKSQSAIDLQYAQPAPSPNSFGSERSSPWHEASLEFKSPHDRRLSRRFAVRDLAEIVGLGRKTTLSCMVLNVSKGGAMIELSSEQLPDRFILINHVTKTRRLCAVVWRCDSLAGVEFLGPNRKNQSIST